MYNIYILLRTCTDCDANVFRMGIGAFFYHYHGHIIRQLNVRYQYRDYTQKGHQTMKLRIFVDENWCGRRQKTMKMMKIRWRDVDNVTVK